MNYNANFFWIFFIMINAVSVGFGQPTVVNLPTRPHLMDTENSIYLTYYSDRQKILSGGNSSFEKIKNHFELASTGFQPYYNSYLLYLPPYSQGPICNFEDYINRKRKFRIDFSVK